ncbi:MAG: hypothetical protein ACI91R_002307 [Vicingaceae bacterium]
MTKSNEISDYDAVSMLDKVEIILLDLKRKGTKVSAAQDSGKPYLFNYFNHIMLPAEVVHYIIQYNSYDSKYKDYLRSGSNVSLALFIEKNRGVQRTINLTKQVKSEIDNYLVGDIDANNRVNESVRQYLGSMITALELIHVLIKQKKLRKEGRAHLKQHFCVFCWRTVRSGSSHTVAQSSFYCSKHHPSEHKDAYLKQRRALINILKKDESASAIKSLQLLENKQLKRGDWPRIFNKHFIKLAPKVPVYQLGNGLPADSIKHNFEKYIELKWRSAATNLVRVIEDYYPEAFKVLNEKVDSYESLTDWIIFGVIGSLSDKCDDEVEYWEKNIHLISANNWQLVLHILRRYEASRKLMRSIRKIGPPAKK